MGQTRAPSPRPRAFTVRASESFHACVCVCLLFQRGEQAYLLVVVCGHEGEGSSTSPASCVGGRLGATEEAVGVPACSKHTGLVVSSSISFPCRCPGMRRYLGKWPDCLQALSKGSLSNYPIHLGDDRRAFSLPSKSRLVEETCE